MSNYNPGDIVEVTWEDKTDEERMLAPVTFAHKARVPRLRGRLVRGVGRSNDRLYLKFGSPRETMRIRFTQSDGSLTPMFKTGTVTVLHMGMPPREPEPMNPFTVMRMRHSTGQYFGQECVFVRHMGVVGGRPWFCNHHQWFRWDETEGYDRLFDGINVRDTM